MLGRQNTRGAACGKQGELPADAGGNQQEVDRNKGIRMHQIKRFQPGFPPLAPCPTPLVSDPCSRTHHSDMEALARAVVQGVRHSLLRQRCEFALPGDGEAVKNKAHFAAVKLPAGNICIHDFAHLVLHEDLEFLRLHIAVALDSDNAL